MSQSLDSCVDPDAFSQILNLDEENDREFSKALVDDYFDQANDTFKEMDKAVEDNDLSRLSALGHFLKGSSAALGFFKVQEHCQIIQQYGKKAKLDGTPEPDEAVCLQKITDSIRAAKTNRDRVKALMDVFYRQQS